MGRAEGGVRNKWMFLLPRGPYSVIPLHHNTHLPIYSTHTHCTKISKESLHKNRACHGWSTCNGICLVSGPDTCKQKPDIFRCIRSSRDRHFLRCSLFKQQSLFRRKFLFKLIHCCVHGRKQERILTKKYYHKELLTLKRSKLYIV